MLRLTDELFFFQEVRPSKEPSKELNNLFNVSIYVYVCLFVCLFVDIWSGLFVCLLFCLLHIDPEISKESNFFVDFSLCLLSDFSLCQSQSIFLYLWTSCGPLVDPL